MALFSDPAIGLAVNGATSSVVNADARPDIVFGSTATDSVYVVLRNAANTGFAAPVQYASVGHKADLEVADFTGDGLVDIVASNDTIAERRPVGPAGQRHLRCRGPGSR